MLCFHGKAAKEKKKGQKKNDERIKQNKTNISVNGGMFVFPLKMFLVSIFTGLTIGKLGRPHSAEGISSLLITRRCIYFASYFEDRFFHFLRPPPCVQNYTNRKDGYCLLTWVTDDYCCNYTQSLRLRHIPPYSSKASRIWELFQGDV